MKPTGLSYDCDCDCCGPYGRTASYWHRGSLVTRLLERWPACLTRNSHCCCFAHLRFVALVMVKCICDTFYFSWGTRTVSCLHTLEGGVILANFLITYHSEL